jgi:hypothetical protein
MAPFFDSVPKQEGHFRVGLLWTPEISSNWNKEEVKQRLADALNNSTNPTFHDTARISGMFGDGGASRRFDEGGRPTWRFVANSHGKGLAAKEIDGDRLEVTIRTLVRELHGIAQALGSSATGRVELTLHEADGCRLCGTNPTGVYSAQSSRPIIVANDDWENVSNQCVHRARNAFEPD